MNWNTIRTFIAATGVVGLLGPFIISWVMSKFGCVGDIPGTPEIEVTLCSGGDLFAIPPLFQSVAGGLILLIVMTLKAVTGTGSLMQNLTAPQAPVVPAADAKPGVVTATQVASER